MKIAISKSIATVIGLCFATGVLAHHSRANFDLETVVSVEGVVTDYNWRNPHVYATMDVVTESGETVVLGGHISTVKQETTHAIRDYTSK